MLVNHNIEECRVWCESDSLTSYLDYEISDGVLDVTHTYVPKQLSGQGIAADMVSYIYDYARQNGLTFKATCSYAEAWLRRHNK